MSKLKVLQNQKLDNTYVSNLIETPSDNMSIMEKISLLPEDQQMEILEEIVKKNYPEHGMKALKYDWNLMARPIQLAPQQIENWSVLVNMSGRGAGKLLNPEELVFSDRGWVTIKELVVGDKLIDEKGNWCTVTNKFSPEIPKKAYRLHFNDGTSIECGEEHYWFTYTHQNRKQYLRYYREKYGKSADCFPESWINYCPDEEMVRKVEEYINETGTTKGIRKKLNINNATIKSILEGNYLFGTKKTTQEIVDTFTHSSRKDTNHCIPTVQPLKLNEQSLLIHPFVFGYWLANGSHISGAIHAHQDDIPHLIKEFTKYGYECTYYPESNNQRFNVLNFVGKLKELGVYGNKRIPEQYLYASAEQRLDLLKGLVTGDGGVDKASNVSYCSSRKNLADDFYWLVISLGMKATRNERIPKYSYKGERLSSKKSYRINFVPTVQVFNLPRKEKLLSFNCEQLLKRKHRMIISFEEIEPYLMQCLKVDSENGAFCIGKQMLISSNTRFGVEYVRYLAENKLVDRMALIARTAGDVHKTLLYGDSGLITKSPEWFKPKVRPAYKEIVWPNGVIANYFPLDVETEVPTIKGFKKLKDIKIGNKVFDENGKVCTVKYVHETEYNQKCFELTFKNQQKVIASANHLWKISTVLDRDWRYKAKDGKPKHRIRTTQEIYDNFKSERKNRNDELNNWIQLSEPVEYEEKQFPLAPYLLGAWLGDGTHDSGLFCTKDSEIPEYFAELGYKVTKCKSELYWYVRGIKDNLKDLNLYKNKHIPEIYKQGSIEQRKELLRGLLDTDGSITPHLGEITFCNTNENIIQGVCEIVHSLGGWTTVHKMPMKKYLMFGKYQQKKVVYKVTIRGLYDIFRLKRKLARVKPRKIYNMIPVTEIKEVESIPVKCIKVDSENSLFLITRSYLPTRNSSDVPDSLRGPQFHFAWIDEYCLTANTLIQTPQGEKKIISIEEGDIVCTHKGDRKVLVSKYTGKSITYTVHFSNGSSLCGTFGHPVSSRKYGWIKLGMLRKGDLVNTFGGTAYVLRVERNPFHWKTYNIEVEDANTYYANGILTHNCALRHLEEVQDMLKMGLRLGRNPQLLVTTTPKPLPQFIEMLGHKRTYTITGSTFDNKANLAAGFIEDIEEQYGGTLLGQQELYGRIISDDKNAIWNRELIERQRFKSLDNKVPPLILIFCAIDPSVTNTKRSAETGITVAGLGQDGNYYILYSEGIKGDSDAWVGEVMKLHQQYRFDKIIAEVNNGGDLVEKALTSKNADIPYQAVRASIGKVPRAVPIQILYERGKIWHVGHFQKLEQQMCNLNMQDIKEKLIDVVDSMVWCIYGLMEYNTVKKSNVFNVAVGGYRKPLLNYRHR